MDVKTLPFKSKESELVWLAFQKVGPDHYGEVCRAFLADELGADAVELLRMAEEDWLENVSQTVEDAGEIEVRVRVRLFVFG